MNTTSIHEARTPEQYRALGDGLVQVVNDETDGAREKHRPRHGGMGLLADRRAFAKAVIARLIAPSHEALRPRLFAHLLALNNTHVINVLGDMLGTEQDDLHAYLVETLETYQEVHRILLVSLTEGEHADDDERDKCAGYVETAATLVEATQQIVADVEANPRAVASAEDFIMVDLERTVDAGGAAL